MSRKAGFWIKKDGTIAVDTKMSNFNAGREKAQRKKAYATTENARKVNLKGKGQKFLREEYIPMLQTKIRNLWVYVNIWKRHVKEMEGKANALIKEKMKRERAYRREIYKKKEKTVRAKALKYSYAIEAQRVADTVKSDKTKYHGHFYMLAADKFIIENKLKKDNFNAIMIASHYKILEPIYFVLWSIRETEAEAATFMYWLKRKGWLEKIPHTRGKYVLSLKSKGFLKDFDDFFYKETRKQTLIISNANRKNNCTTKTPKFSGSRLRPTGKQPE